MLVILTPIVLMVVGIPGIMAPLNKQHPTGSFVGTFPTWTPSSGWKKIGGG